MRDPNALRWLAVVDDQQFVMRAFPGHGRSVSIPIACPECGAKAPIVIHVRPMGTALLHSHCMRVIGELVHG